jgi:3-dehydroquinate synthase
MTATETLRVDLGERGYDIVVGDGLIDGAGAWVKDVIPIPRVIVVTDENVAPLYLDRLLAALADADVAAESIVLPPGEQTKCFSIFEGLCEDILARKVERKTTLLALGGGVIGDITGFAAATVLRGMPFVQVPTTLLAQVDSSVGGKTGINTRHGKNLVGAFHQPRLVLADVETLETLPERELLAGYAEVAKYGLIDRPDFFAWLEENGEALVGGDRALRREAVLSSCAAKAAIVAEDEREAGKRALLNLGHTFGHALEAESGYGEALLHGEAVAIGMALAFELSARTGLCPAEDAERVRAHLGAVGLRTGLTDNLAGPDWTADKLMDHMTRDKKVSGGRLTYVLVRGIGRAFLTQDVDPADVRALLLAALNR